jgi:F-type H+-transporting ATPase subunit delta
LVDLAMEKGAIPQVEQDVKELRAMLSASPELRSMTKSPLIGAQAQQAGLAAIADRAGFHDLTRNFLFLLAANRRLGALDFILKAVEKTLSSRRGEIQADVESASPLSAAQQETLQDGLTKTMGRPVMLTSKTNANLIGGIVVTMGSIMIDDSIKTKLDNLGRAMKSGGKAA